MTGLLVNDGFCLKIWIVLLWNGWFSQWQAYVLNFGLTDKLKSDDWLFFLQGLVYLLKIGLFLFQCFKV